MTTSYLVGLDSQSSQETTATTVQEPSLLGAATRVGAYNRLKAWLKLSPAEASFAAAEFRDAVAALPAHEQQQIREAEADALHHGFSFPDFQRLRSLALDALSNPGVAAGLADDGIGPSANLAAAMLAMSR